MRTVPTYPVEILYPCLSIGGPLQREAGAELHTARQGGGRRTGERKLVKLVRRVVQARRHAPIAQDIVPKGEPIESKLAERAALDQSIDRRGSRLQVVSAGEYRVGKIGEQPGALASTGGRSVGRLAPPFEQIHLRPELIGRTLDFKQAG